MTEDEFAAYQSLSEETEDHRWAFGTGFTDPLEGIDASVPDGVDAAALTAYCLALGDDALIYSHRLQQWMTRMPELEEETALANIALDLLGQARMLLARAGQAEGRGRREDDLAFFRDEHEFRSVRLAEHTDADFAELAARMLVFSSWRLALFGALAASAADWLSRERCRPVRAGFVGTGLIARYIHTFLTGTGWTFDEIGVHDLSAEHAAGFRGYLEKAGPGRITVYEDAEQLIRSSDLVVFATIAGEPHVSDLSWFEHNPVVLHVSLRDLAPEILLASTNLVDDVEHCLKANTSPHLAEQLTGSRDFLAGTLDDVMSGRVTVPADRPVVFSPFGLGVLDLAVGKYVYDEVTRSGDLHVIDDFFHELKRYGTLTA